MKKRSVLIVDDEPEIIEIINHSLSKEDVFLKSANNANSAFEIIMNDFIDILVTDIRMEIGNGGLELLEKIQTLPPNDRPVTIVVTGASDLTDEDINNFNVKDVLRKPFTPEELTDSISRVLKNLD